MIRSRSAGDDLALTRTCRMRSILIRAGETYHREGHRQSVQNKLATAREAAVLETHPVLVGGFRGHPQVGAAEDRVERGKAAVEPAPFAGREREIRAENDFHRITAAEQRTCDQDRGERPVEDRGLPKDEA